MRNRNLLTQIFLLALIPVLLLGCGSEDDEDDTGGSVYEDWSSSDDDTSSDSSDGNDTYEDAQMVQSTTLGDQGFSSVFSAAIEHNNDRDFIGFTVQSSGEVVIETSSDSSLDPFCSLFLDHQLVDDDDDSGPGLECRLVAEVDSAEELVLQVRSYGGNSSGNYQFTVNWVPQQASSSREENDERSGATYVSGSSSGNHQTELGWPGDVDWFEIIPGVGGDFRFWTEGNQDTVCEIYDKDVELLDTNDDGEDNLNCHLESFGLDWDLGWAGDSIWVKVYGSNEEQTGSYEVFWEMFDN